MLVYFATVDLFWLQWITVTACIISSKHQPQSHLSSQNFVENSSTPLLSFCELLDQFSLCFLPPSNFQIPCDHRKRPQQNNRKALLENERRIESLVTRGIKISWWRSQLSFSYMHFLRLFWEKRDRMGFSPRNFFYFNEKIGILAKGSQE